MSGTETVDHNDFNQNLIAEYRANGGKVTGMFANTPLLLLTTNSPIQRGNQLPRPRQQVRLAGSTMRTIRAVRFRVAVRKSGRDPAAPDAEGVARVDEHGAARGGEEVPCAVEDADAVAHFLGVGFGGCGGIIGSGGGCGGVVVRCWGRRGGAGRR